MTAVSGDPLVSRREAVAFAGVAISLVTAAGYVVGYISVSNAASRLDVSNRDLGLTFTDYILLPAWSYIAVTLGALAFIVWDRQQPQWRRGTLRQRVWGVARPLVVGVAMVFGYMSAAVALGAGSGLGLAGVVLPIVMFGVAAIAETVWRRDARWGAALILVLVVLTAFITVRTGAQWADDVHAYADDGENRPDGWLTPGRALSPQIGRASWADGVQEQCVVRVGEGVLVGSDGVLVVSGLDEFRPTDCEVVKRP